MSENLFGGLSLKTDWLPGTRKAKEQPVEEIEKEDVEDNAQESIFGDF